MSERIDPMSEQQNIVAEMKQVAEVLRCSEAVVLDNAAAERLAKEQP